MRILFLADVPAGKPESGAEQVLFQQTKGCAEAGHEVCAITRRHRGGSDLLLHDWGLLEGSYPADPGHPLSFFAALHRDPQKLYHDLSQQGRFHALVAHQPFTCLPLLLSGAIRSIPLLYVFHSPGHEEYLLANQNSPQWKTTLPALIRRGIEAYVIRKAKRVMALSDYMGRKAASIHGIKPEQILINPGGVDLIRFSPPTDRNTLKIEMGWPPDRIHLLSIRNFEPRMGLDALVRALARLNRHGPRYHLTLGGDGPERDNLIRLVHELNLERVVTMTGFIPDHQMARWYGSADFFILPTRSLEGFGLVTPESLACGTPVLGTPIGGTAEILSRFDNRFLFHDSSQEAMEDGITQAVTDFPLRTQSYQQLREDCRNFASNHYAWQRHNELLLSTLTALTRPQARC